MGRHSLAASPAQPRHGVPETTRLSRSQQRAIARAQAKRLKWQRYSAIPAVCALVGMYFADDAYHVVFPPASAAAERPVGASTDLSALAITGSQTASQVSGLQRVSRGTRSRDTASLPAAAATSVGAYSLAAAAGTSVDAEPLAAAAGTSVDAESLPARPGLPKVDPYRTVSGTWVRPSAGEMSTCFCMRWGTFHEGIDLAGPLGSPIVATGDGVVLEAGPAEGFGHWIVIQQSNGDVTIYGHMFVVLVSKGQHVKAGDHIADIGDDGEATGPHLHFGVRQGGINGPYIDPVPWLRARGVTIGTYDPNA